MNILLVYPKFPDTLWSFKHALKFIRKKAYSPPLGLLTVAAMLPSEWTKRLVDLNVEKLHDEDLKWADYVFISAMIVQKDSVRQIVARCKEVDVKIVAGGPLFMIEHEQFEEIDHLVLSEAEATLPSFLADLVQGDAKHVYRSSEFAKLSNSPPPLWKLADLRWYSTMSIQLARGCPHNCEFCSVTPLFGGRSRNKTTKQIIAELDNLYNMGWRESIFFVDDNFIGDKRYVKTEVLPALIEWQKGKEGITFYTAVSIKLADDEDLMQMMVDAGFDTVFIGIETPNDSSLVECGKKQNRNRSLLEDVKRLQRIGLEVQGGFIVGFDSDDENTIFDRQIGFIQDSGIVTATVGILQAIPGTKLYKRLDKEGRLRGKLSLDIIDGTINFVPIMNSKTLQAEYKNLMRHIYSPKHYYQRVKTLLKEHKPPKVRASLNLKHIIVLFRTFYYLGIIGKERHHYWKLLLWTGFRRPKSISLAVRHAIFGYHFRKIVELQLK